MKTSHIVQLIPCTTELWACHWDDELGSKTPIADRMQSRILCLALVEETCGSKTYRRIVGVSWADKEIYLVEEDCNFYTYSEKSIRSHAI